MQNFKLDVFAALPEMLLLGMAMLVLMAGLFIKNKNRLWVYGLAQATLLLAGFILVQTHENHVFYAFNRLFVDDALADVLKLFTTLGASMMLVYTHQYCDDRKLLRGEYYALVLFATLGMFIMISGQHFISIYIGLELLSLSLYSLVAFDRDNVRASEAAMKYFVLGALASGMLLYGMSLVYGMTSTLNISDVASQLLKSDVHNPVLILGLVFIVAGLAFKLGAVPFQMWVPDVYQGAPTSMTLLIGSIPKFAAFAIVIRLLAQGLQLMLADWQDMLLIMAVLSIAIGNATAIAQTNLKRMLAYSTISHIGFLLFGLMSGSLNGYSASLFYIVAYVLMTLSGFGMLLLLSKKGFEAENLTDLKGLNSRDKWLAFLMLITMFSMAGVPPTLGFYAKFSVLQAAFEAGFIWPVVAAVLLAAVGAFYYLRVVWYMYFEPAETDVKINRAFDVRWVLSLNALALLALGLLPNSLMAVCNYAIQQSVH